MIFSASHKCILDDLVLAEPIDRVSILQPLQMMVGVHTSNTQIVEFDRSTI